MGLLDAKNESAYRLWGLLNNVPESNDYDMRGFFMHQQNPLNFSGSEINPNDGKMHFPDTFKRPNHPTFSTGSKYYNPETMPMTPSWAGGILPTVQGSQSWSLVRPNGEIVAQEAPFIRSHIKGLLGE